MDRAGNHLYNAGYPLLSPARTGKRTGDSLLGSKMADSKQILVVDDHFEMLEFLRSMLELSNADYQVLGVPSAEEGLLELHRRPFDLLITDVRLPGMSGFDLVRKAKVLRAELPVLMITGYASAQGRQEAEQLGVARYFEKPLDTDALLATVQATLYAQPAAPKAPDSAPLASAAATRETRASAKPPAAMEEDEGARRAVARRLQTLLADTGAVQAMIANGEGAILYRAGGGDQPMARLARLMSRSLADSFELAAVLGSVEPFTIQYQAGERVDLYTANIGRRHFLMLHFDAGARRGRIGTVWVFAQRAIKELREMLPQAAVEDVSVDPEDGPVGQEDVSVSKEDVSTGAADVNAREPGAGAKDLSDLWEEMDVVQDVDLDAFWEEATTDAGSMVGRGLSFDEAVQRGLLPPDLNK